MFTYDYAVEPFVKDDTTNVLDKRYSEAMVKALNGLDIKAKIDKRGTFDLGMGVLIKIEPVSRYLSGAISEQIEDGAASGF